MSRGPEVRLDDPRLERVIAARQAVDEAEEQLDEAILEAKNGGATAESLATAAGYATRRSIYQAADRARKARIRRSNTEGEER